MSVATFDCPGFARDSENKVVEIGDKDVTLPVIVQEIGKKVNLVCIALKDGKCRKLKDEIREEDSKDSFIDCPYAEVLDERSSHNKPRTLGDSLDILSGKAMR